MPSFRRLRRRKSSCSKQTCTSKTGTSTFPCPTRKSRCRVRKSNPRNLCLDSLDWPRCALAAHKRSCRRALLCPFNSPVSHCGRPCPIVSHAPCKRPLCHLEPCPQVSRPICNDSGTSCPRSDVRESQCKDFQDKNENVDEDIPECCIPEPRASSTPFESENVEDCSECCSHPEPRASSTPFESDNVEDCSECCSRPEPRASSTPFESDNVEDCSECCSRPEPRASSTPYEPCCIPKSPQTCLKTPTCVSEEPLPECCVSIKPTPSCSKKQSIPRLKPSGSGPVRRYQENSCCNTPPICPHCEESSCQTGHIECETGLRKHKKNSTDSKTTCALFPQGVDSCCGTPQDLCFCKDRSISKSSKDIIISKEEEKRFKKEEKARKKAEKKARKKYEKERKKALKRRKSGKDNCTSSDSMLDSSYASSCSSCCNSSESKSSKKEGKRNKEMKKGKSEECAKQGMCESTNDAADPCGCSKDTACSCTFPPAYQQFSCMGNINGSCNCQSCPSEN